MAAGPEHTERRPEPASRWRSAPAASRQEQDVARLDVGSPARILTEGGDRRQCRDLLAALDDEGLIAKALADRCRISGGVLVRTGQELEQNYRAVARDGCSSAVKEFPLPPLHISLLRKHAPQ